MIQVNKLHKYFRKGKTNEIHVINNTNLEFGNTGLVCILGESGSGKTTLLNTLGGLDVFQQGSISFEDTTITKNSKKEMEKIRNSRFGYIFQEKYLLQDRTVAYNINLALNMYDISEEEKEARIDYVLKSVDMMKYKKRLVSQLSGGQQQRIAIARALVKSPEIIFADEPTGSLDENNTMRIISIIKKISKDCLVILVTHEKRIAEFFADRIIQVKDGKVIYDAVGKEQKTYQYSDDNNLYLKELDKRSYYQDCININLYRKEEGKPLELNLVYLNDKYYIQTPEDNVVFLSPGDEIQMVDNYKPKLELSQVEEFEYSLERIEAKKRPRLSIKDIYSLAKNNVKMLGSRKLFMLGTFIIASVLLVIAVVDYLTASAIDKKDIITEDSNYINVTALRNSSVENDEYVASYLPIYNKFITDKIATDIYVDLNEGLSFTDNSYEQINQLQYTMKDFSYVTLEHFTREDLICGRMPENRNEVIIDKWLLDVFKSSDSILTTLFHDTEDFLGIELRSKGPVLTVVGISDLEEPTVFIDKYMGLSLLTPDNTIASLDQLRAAYHGQYEDIKLGKDEILVPEDYRKINRPDGNNQIPINGDMYTVVGTYPEDFGVAYVIEEDDYNYVLSRMICKERKFMIYSKEKAPILNYFAKNLGGFDQTYVELKVSDTYKEQLEEFQKERAMKMNVRLIATLAIFGVSVFMLYFTMKANVIKRVQEISVYRLLGISKRSIIASFVLEVIIMTSYTVLPVVLVVSSIIKFIAAIPSFQLEIVYPWLAMAVLLIFIYAVNIIVGMIPVYGIVKLPPARIADKA